MLTASPRNVFTCVCLVVSLAACAQSVSYVPGAAADARPLDVEHTPDATDDRPDATDDRPDATDASPDRGCVEGDPACDPDALALPMTIADMALDRDGNILVAGTWHSPTVRESSAAAVVRIDPRLGTRLVPLVESSPMGLTSAVSASPTDDGGAWVAWGPCPSEPSDDLSCVTRLSSLAGAPVSTVRGPSFEGPPWFVRSLADGGAIVAAQRTEFVTGLSGIGIFPFDYVELLRVDERGAVRWRSMRRDGSLRVGGFAVSDGVASTLMAVGDELVLESWSLDGESLRHVSLGGVAAGSAMTLGPDGRLLVARAENRERRAPDGDLTLFEVPAHGGAGPARPIPVRVEGDVLELRVASGVGGRAFVMFEHNGSVTVQGVAAHDREGIIVIEASPSGVARVVAELPRRAVNPAVYVPAAPTIVAALDGRLVVALNVASERGDLSSVIRWLRTPAR